MATSVSASVISQSCAPIDINQFFSWNAPKEDSTPHVPPELPHMMPDINLRASQSLENPDLHEPLTGPVAYTSLEPDEHRHIIFESQSSVEPNSLGKEEDKSHAKLNGFEFLSPNSRIRPSTCCEDAYEVEVMLVYCTGCNSMHQLHPDTKKRLRDTKNGQSLCSFSRKSLHKQLNRLPITHAHQYHKFSELKHRSPTYDHSKLKPTKEKDKYTNGDVLPQIVHQDEEQPISGISTPEHVDSAKSDEKRSTNSAMDNEPSNGNVQKRKPGRPRKHPNQIGENEIHKSADIHAPSSNASNGTGQCHAEHVHEEFTRMDFQFNNEDQESSDDDDNNKENIFSISPSLRNQNNDDDLDSDHASSKRNRRSNPKYADTFVTESGTVDTQKEDDPETSSKKRKISEDKKKKKGVTMWSTEEEQSLLKAVKSMEHKNWDYVASLFHGRTPYAVRDKYLKLVGQRR